MKHIYQMLLKGLYVEEIAQEQNIEVEKTKQEIEYWKERCRKIPLLNEFLQFLSNTQGIKFNVLSKITADYRDRKGFPIGYIDKLLADYSNNNYYIATFIIKQLERNRLWFYR